MRPSALTLFCGVGGLDLGLESAGFDIMQAIDIDPIHAACHQYNFPYCQTVCADISKIDVKSFSFATDFDLISITAPCQGFSNKGKKNPKDPRNQLSFKALNFIFEIRPKYFIVENVPAIALPKNVKILHKLITKFKRNGYSIVEPVSVLNSYDFLTPQKRKRLFLLGYRQDCPAPNYPEINNDYFTAGDAIADLENINPYYKIDKGIDKGFLNNYLIYCKYAQYLPYLYSKCHIRGFEPNIWNHLASIHSKDVKKRFAKATPGKKEPVSRFFKLDQNQPANTLLAGTPANKGSHTASRPIHYKYPRCITAREAARIQGFPDWFNFARSIAHAHRQIGNSVPPLVAQAIGNEIIKCLGLDSKTFEIQELPSSPDDLLKFSNTKAATYWSVSPLINGKRRRVNA